MHPSSTHVRAYVDRTKAALNKGLVAGQRPPIVRRKLGRLLDECRKRSSPKALTQIDQAFVEAGLHCRPRLTEPGLRRGDWVLVSTETIPPELLLFRDERQLRTFVKECLGTGPFRNLELFDSGSGSSSEEFRLPDGRRIDLVCQERAKSGPGALVAIEFERGHEQGSAEQLIGYLKALEALYPKRHVKGLVVSGREDRVPDARLPETGQGYDIRWLCYRVSFHEVTASRRHDSGS